LEENLFQRSVFAIASTRSSPNITNTDLPGKETTEDLNFCFEKKAAAPTVSVFLTYLISVERSLASE